MEFNQPVPELPVSDVENAQHYYEDCFGFQIEWIYPGKEIGAVSHGDTAIFFRRRDGAFEPATLWIFCSDADQSYAELKTRGAKIVEPIEDKPWGLRQFTVHDLDGNIFYFHG